MTTTSRSSPMACNTDAGFRAWIQEVQSMLAAIGLVQTSDTGQINSTTCTRPTSNGGAVGGGGGSYEIWRFNDSLQATSPLFIKIEYTIQNFAGSNQGNFYITVGTGTNGAGTLTGTVSARLYVGMNANISGDYSFTTAYPSYACHTEGVAWLCSHVGYAGGVNYGYSPATAFHIERFSDLNGTPNGNGFTITYLNTGASTTAFAYYSFNHNWQPVRTQAPATVFAAQAGVHGFWPHQFGTTYGSANAAGDLQLVPLFTVTKEIQQQWAILSYLATEISQGTTFTATIKGATPRTYIALGGGMGAVQNSQCVCAAVWE